MQLHAPLPLKRFLECQLSAHMLWSVSVSDFIKQYCMTNRVHIRRGYNGKDLLKTDGRYTRLNKSARHQLSGQRLE